MLLIYLIILFIVALYSIFNLLRVIFLITLQFLLVEMIGFEPTTYGLQSHRSPTEPHPHLMVGRGGFEPPTSRLSAACSNQLSYRPMTGKNSVNKLITKANLIFCCKKLHRKEVIQPHVPVRLPCYDFTPLTRHTFDGSSLKG